MDDEKETDVNRNIVIALAVLLALAWAVQAQTANPLSAEAKQAYTSVKNNLLRAAEKMPEAEYAFKPVPEIRAWGELVAHIADSNARACGTVKGEQKPVNAASKKTKAEIAAALKESFDICDGVYDALTDAVVLQTVAGRGGAQVSKLSVLTGNLAHLNEEYGYGCLYLRLKGIVPPSSDRTPAK
jgi:hypothetical protein